MQVTVFKPFFSKRKGSYVPGVYGERFDISFNQLCKTMTTFRDNPGDKQECRSWSPAIFGSNPNNNRDHYRNNNSCIELSCLVLDYDDGYTIEEAQEKWGKYRYILHTSWSHSFLQHKYRLIVPLARACARDDFRKLWYWAYNYSGGTIDQQCKDPSRLYFLPYKGKNNECESYCNRDGELLDLDYLTLEDPPSPEYTTRSKSASQQAQGRGGPFLSPKRGVKKYIDAGSRIALADQLGGRVRGLPERADGIQCPNCRRKSVWFWINPGSMRGFECSHKNSCGCYGFLDELHQHTLGG